MNTLDHQTTDRPSSTNFYKWAVVGMLWFVCFFNYADRQAIFSVFPLLRSEMHLSTIELGVVGSAFMWVYAAMCPVAGWIGDRVSRKKLIISGLLFWSAVTLATAMSTTYTELVFFRAIEGLGEAVYFPAAMSMVSDYHGPRTRSKAMAVIQSSVYAGTIAGGAVAGYLAELKGWRTGFYLFGSLGVLLGIVLIGLLKEPVRGESDAIEVVDGPGDEGVEAVPVGHAHVPNYASPPLRSNLAAVFKKPIVLILIAVFMCANFVAAVYLTWMPSFLHKKFHMSLSMAGLNGTAWIQIASVVGVISGGVLADWLAKRIAAGRMLTQLLGLAVGVPFIFLTGYAASTTVLVLAMVGFGYFKGLYDANLWASLYDVVPIERRGAALGVMNSLGWVGGGIAPVAIAAASERYGLSDCLSATSVVYAIAAMLMIVGLILLALRESR